jgi:hypothetical protein
LAAQRRERARVRSERRQPFRADTPAGHGDGRWLRDWLAALGVDLSTRVIHLRGVHYALIGHPKPDGPDHSKNFSGSCTDPSAGDLFTQAPIGTEFGATLGVRARRTW